MGETPLIFYDLTRLVDRRLSPVATGIDRVDLHFARAVFDAYGERCLPIVKVGPRAFLADRGLAEALVQSLERTWFEGRPHDLQIARALELAGLTQRIDGMWVESPTADDGPCASGGGRRFSRILWGTLNALTKAGGFLWSRSRNALRREARRSILERLAGGEVGIYVVCSHGGVTRCRGVLPSLNRLCGLKAMAYVHDLIPLQYPEYTRTGKPEELAGFFSELAGARASFVANSRDTAWHLEDLAKRRHWSIGEVAVVYPGVETRPAAAGSRSERERRRKAASPYFVVVGTIEPRKNHLLLLQVWRSLVRSGTQPMPRLHIVGRRGWENQNVLSLIERCEAIRPFVIEHNRLGDPELRRLIRGARAVLFPSFAEGFGLPLVEALQLGAPVIASDLPVFREVAGLAPRYVDPLDALGWRQAIVDCLAETGVPAPETAGPLTGSADWKTRAGEFLAQLGSLASTPLDRECSPAGGKTASP